MFGFKRRAGWAVFHCLTGEYREWSRLPFVMGSGPAADLRLEGEGVAERHAVVAEGKDGKPGLFLQHPDARIHLDGLVVQAENLEPERDYSVQIGGHFLMLRGGNGLREWRRGLDEKAWFVVPPGAEAPLGPWPFEELVRRAAMEGWAPKSVVLPQGAQTGFYLRQLPVVCVAGETPVATPGGAPEAPGAEEAPVPETVMDWATLNGALICPVCWLRFEVGDLMHVAVHDLLRGDPVLGADVPLRFRATRFNDRGQALDAFGLPAVDTACPHCRRVLPPGFAEVTHHIVSIVGDQSAGKSYYLSVLAHLLPVTLYRRFGVNFQDADPGGNAMLNDMKRTLFGARTPEEARLVKTQLEGAMYERVPRYGRFVALPRPFVYYLGKASRPEHRVSLVFYDNAGEHFQPGRDSSDSPGAQHVASSTGVLFLFDPFNHPEFRRRMGSHPDPQLERPVVDQQDVLLSELKARVHRLLNLGVGELWDRPLAVLVGKCDAWMGWLGPDPFDDPVRDGCLDGEAVARNSRRVRELLLEVAPTIVSNAEATSRDVVYFPVSSFGHAPVKVGSGSYVPDPALIRPVLAEVPVLWILSRIQPELVPGR